MAVRLAIGHFLTLALFVPAGVGCEDRSLPKPSEHESTTDAEPIYFPGSGDGWLTKTPEAIGMDAGHVEEAAAFAMAHETSMDQDLGEYLRRRFDMTFSVTKSTFSTLAGVAVAEGRIGDLDERVAERVDGYFDAGHNDAITWRHLLQQTEVVPAQWVDRATTQVAIQPNYSFMWWLNTGRERFPSAPETAFPAIGAGSTSTIVVDPEHDVVIVSRWVEGEHVDGLIERVHSAIR